MAPEILTLVAITFLAATVNGALGYGFSSLTVPVALLFYTNRVLNPTLVLIEVVLNAYVLWANRSAVPAVWRRVLPILIGLLPGVALGTWLIYRVNPGWVKLFTYGVLTPMILLQAGGIRRPIRKERAAGLALGSGVGVLYSVTTISGPPLALMFNNQGYVKQEFRAGLGLVRFVESSLTAIFYLYAGMFTAQSLALSPYIIPSVLVGIPLGVFLIRRVPSETFRRICMSFDAWIVGFGFSKVLNELGMVTGAPAFGAMALVGGIDLVLLYRYFAKPKGQPAPIPMPVAAEETARP